MNWLLAFAGPAMSIDPMGIDPLMATFNAIARQCSIGAAVRSNRQATAAV